MSNIKVIGAQWSKDRSTLKEIRTEVFVREQGVPEELEMDSLDTTAEHFIAYDNDKPVGCARLIDNKKIGRMAVLSSHRNSGVGKLILDHIKRYAAQKRYTLLQLSAQCHAYNFYQLSEFKAYSKPYEDAGIPHIDMELRTFSKETDHGGQYQLGSDTEIYHGENILEAAGYFDMALSQCSKSLVLALTDLSHPLCNHAHLLEKIKQQARKNRHFKVYILLANYHASYNEHPIFRLADRLPSFIEIKQCNNSFSNQFVIDGVCWFELEGNTSRVCYADRSKTKHFMERFNIWWQGAKSIGNARRLSI